MKLTQQNEKNIMKNWSVIFQSGQKGVVTG